MVKDKKNKKDPMVASIVKGISYGTGLLCGKVSKVGKFSGSKKWEKVLAKTKGIVEGAGKKVQDGLTEMKESFDEGVQSIAEDEGKVKTCRGTHEQEPIDMGSQKQEPIDILSSEPLTVKPKRARSKKAVKKAVKKAEDAQAPEPAEIVEASAGVAADGPQEQEQPRAETKEESVVQRTYPAEFFIDEFKKEGKDPQDLIDSICKNKPGIYIEAKGPVEWLNKLLVQGESGGSLHYDIQDAAEITGAREGLDSASQEEKAERAVHLNRLILEAAYPLKCPKTQAGADAPKE